MITYWTKSWNPVTGCYPPEHVVSAGCRNCYARRMVLNGLGSRYNGFAPTFHRDRMDEPMSWKKPQVVFISNMGDLFHPAISDQTIRQIIEVTRVCRKHQFLVLSKNPYRMRSFAFPENVLVGTSICLPTECQRNLDDLMEVDAPGGRWISFEPLLGEITANGIVGLHRVQWFVIGGENAPENARPMLRFWVDRLIAFARDNHIPVFYKGSGDNPSNPLHTAGYPTEYPGIIQSVIDGNSRLTNNDQCLQTVIDI